MLILQIGHVYKKSLKYQCTPNMSEINFQMSPVRVITYFPTHTYDSLCTCHHLPICQNY